MVVEQFRTGGDRNLAYLCADEKWKSTLIIDPSFDPESIHEYVKDWNLKVDYIINTHRHEDHTNGNEHLRRYTGRRAVAYGDVEEITQNKLLDGARLPLGNLEIEIIHTPGHTEDCICLRVGDALFTGDTLFVGKIGGTSTREQALTQYHSLHEKLLTLPDTVRVFPGHDVGVSPESSIGLERKTNPFLLQPDFESFYELKQNWLEYKSKHGIA